MKQRNIPYFHWEPELSDLPSARFQHDLAPRATALNQLAPSKMSSLMILWLPILFKMMMSSFYNNKSLRIAVNFKMSTKRMKKKNRIKVL